MLRRLLILLVGILGLCVVALLCARYCIQAIQPEKEEAIDKRTHNPSPLSKAHEKPKNPAIVEMIKTPEGELHLVGAMSSNQQRQNFLAMIQRQTSKAVVYDNLTVRAGRELTPIRLQEVLPILKGMKSGVVSIWEKKMNVTAVVDTRLEQELLHEEIARIQKKGVELTNKIIVMGDQRSGNADGQRKKAQACQNALNKRSQKYSIEYEKVDGVEVLKQNAVLQGYLNIVVSCREHLIVIEGHYANSRDHNMNQQQSEQFATEVLQYFQTHSPEALNLVARGQGDAYPLYDNSTVMGQAMNRRIEFKVKEQ